MTSLHGSQNLTGPEKSTTPAAIAGNKERPVTLKGPEVLQMLSSVFSLGLESLDRLANKAVKGQVTPSKHPLSAYPRLQSLLVEAERSGKLAAERNRLVRQRLAA